MSSEVPTWVQSVLDPTQATPSAAPVIQDASQMNAVLDMMASTDRPNDVLQLFGAFTSAGVMPNLETYCIVTKACAGLGMFQCIEVLLRAAETQELAVEGLLGPCLEAAAAEDASAVPADKAFVLAWAPQAVAAKVPLPASCCALLLEECALRHGLGVATKLHQELVASGTDEASCSAALMACAAAAPAADRLRFQEVLHRCAPTPTRAGATPERAAAGPAHVTPEKLSPTGARASKDSSKSACRPPPGLEVEPAVGTMDALAVAEQAGDYDTALRIYKSEVCSSAAAAEELLDRVLRVCAAAARAPGADAKAILLAMQGPLGGLSAKAYNAVVAALASRGKFDQVERLVEEMRAAHAQPDAQTFNALLDSAARTGRYEKGWSLLSQMLKAGFQVDKYPVSLLLKGVNDKGDKAKMKRGVELVEKYIEVQKDDVDDVLFNSLLDACCRTRDVPRLHRTLQKMRTYGVKPSAATFGTLLKAYGQQKDGDNVLRVWKEMHEAEVGVNPVTYGCMLDACVKCDFFDLSEDVFAEMREVGLHRNTILYTTVIKGCARQKKLKKALGIMAEMKQEGVPLNHVTYNSLIDTAIRCRDLPAATRLLEAMKDDKITPDLITYSTLMKGFCDQGDLGVALNLYGKLSEQGMKPDEIMYNSLLEGCVKVGEVKTGLELFDEMLQKHVQPSNITFSILVKLYARMDRLDQALDLVQQMEHLYHVRPTFVVFTALVKCCVASNRLQVAGSLLLGLPRAAGVQPDHQMLATVLPGLASQGHHEMALDILEQYVKALNGQAKPAAWEQAQRVFQQAGRTGSFVVKEKARQLAQTLAAARLLAPESAAALVGLLGAQGWQGAEFVPGQMWEGAEQFAEPQQQWAPYAMNYAQTPLRKGKQSRDENASPNVMQMLLSDDGSSKGRAQRNVRRPAVSPGSGRKTAPLVAKNTFAPQPLEYVAMSFNSPGM